MKEPKHLVVSAVSFSEGGPLTILQDSLDAASEILSPDWKITAIVHQGSLISNPRVVILEFPQAKCSWLNRLYFEWFYFRHLSDRLQPDLWLSLHDITPRVSARRQAVYCHNPSPFYRLTWSDARREPSFAVFNLLYSYVYRIFIRRNYAVVVQQEWLRDIFRCLYKHKNIVVAHPNCNNFTTSVTLNPKLLPPIRGQRPLRFLYPALPRVFKNFEILCEAMLLLPIELHGLVDLRLTINGSENAYARDLWRRYSLVPGISFIGRQTRQQMEIEYQDCDVVLFPSMLETWGLPITEAKRYGKRLLVADLDYAHETVGNWNAVTFLPPRVAHVWADAFKKIALGEWQFGSQARPIPEEPFVSNWPQLWHLLTEGL
jgi:glycosyltransferase involved in cell wall biosynthesis